MRGLRILACAAGAFALGGGILTERAARAPLAGSARRMELEELVAHAELVLEARVVSIQALETDDGRIYSDCQLAVERTFLGEDLGVRTVRLPGGVLPSGRGLLIPGMSVPVAGEELFLALSAPGPAGARVVVGLCQGRYRIVRDASGARYAVRDDSSALLLGAPGAAVASHTVVEYAEMVARLEAAANAARAVRGREGR